MFGMTSSIHTLLAADAATVTRERSRRASRAQRTRTRRVRERSTFPRASVPRAQTM